jgi:hypothetical protein
MNQNTQKRWIFPFFSKSRESSVAVGCEITQAEKKGKDGEYVKAEGRVSLRFFNTAVSKEKHVRMMLEPWESFSAYLVMDRIGRFPEGRKETIATHKFESGGEEVVTTLQAEKWARNGKSGYALIVQRGKELSYNVPLPEAQFLYAAEALRFLSTNQGYQLVPKPGNEGGHE